MMANVYSFHLVLLTVLLCLLQELLQPQHACQAVRLETGEAGIVTQVDAGHVQILFTEDSSLHSAE